MNDELRTMLQRDRASAMLGMRVELDEPGHAIVSMPVREDMTNGFAITHGGFVFAVADTAFAMACNEDAQVTVRERDSMVQERLPIDGLVGYLAERL